jgi:hypothetical protein
MVNAALPEKRRVRPTTWLALAVGATAGLAVASVMLSIAFQENSQGEFFDPATGAVDWPYSLALFGLWFLVIAVPIAVATWGVLALHSHFRRSKGST